MFSYFMSIYLTSWLFIVLTVGAFLLSGINDLIGCLL
jgi:hypothetical protein